MRPSTTHALHFSPQFSPFHGCSRSCAKLLPGFDNQKTIPIMNGVVAAAVLCVVALYFPTRASLQEGLAEEFPWKRLRPFNLPGER